MRLAAIPLLALVVMTSAAAGQNAPMRGPNGRYHVLEPGVVAPKQAPQPTPEPPPPPQPELKPYIAPPPPIEIPLPPQPDAVVTTTFGQVGGEDYGDGTWTFKAIPFASPPVGDLRWMPPEDPAHWKGVRYNPSSAPACLQVSYGWNADLAKSSSEDCLYLEVRTPDLDSHAKKAVMVFIHGGANRAGGGAGTIYSGFAGKDVVIVSLQYRLGVFGFMSHPALTRESGHDASGNYALLDLMQALYWVKTNIAQFGGDPNNVTIFGHSAGAGDVGLLMSSPLARGLFNKAISESGPPQFGFPPRTLAQNEDLGTQLAAQFSAKQPDGQAALADLRRAPAAELQAAADKLDAPIDDDSFIWDQAVVDGYVLSHAPEDVFRAGREAHVPLIIGVSAREIGLHGGDDAIYRKIYDTFGDQRFKAMRFYGVDVSHKPKTDKLLGDVAMQVSTDTMMRCPADWVAWHHTAAGGHAWLYQLDVTEGEGPVHHGSELSYVMNERPFGKHDGDWPPLQDYWINFARTGNPNGADASGRAMTGWPAYGAGQAYAEFTRQGVATGRNLRGGRLRLAGQAITAMAHDNLSGHITDLEHFLPVRIYYEDTDFSGVVYHANYLKYFERGRSEYMRLLGVHHHQLAGLDEPLAFAVAEITIRYKAPAKIDELIVVRSRLISARGASFIIDQSVERQEQVLASGRVHVVCIDGQGRPKRLARHLMDVLKTHIVAEKHT